LSLHDEMALVFEIEAAVRDGRAPDEIQEVLLSFRRREDLLAKIAARLDEALKAKAAPAAASVHQTAPSPAKAPGTKSLGAWDQMKMPDKVFAYIENRFVYA
jgi:hypothetical protein